MASILAKGPLFLGSLFGVRPAPGSGTTPGGHESGSDNDTQISEAAESALESQTPEHSKGRPQKHVGNVNEIRHQSHHLQPSVDETDKHTEHTSGFSSSGKYNLIRDVIVRAEFISDRQTKVLIWGFQGVPRCSPSG